jgi:hypothetical protein
MPSVPVLQLKVSSASNRHAGPRRRLVLLAALLSLATFAGPATPANADETGSPAPTASTSGFDSQGMWVWYVSKSNHGNVAQIIERAKRSRVSTVYIKAGDATTTWSQFTSSLVDALHAGGLKVCAWQFVYGDAPYKEAGVGAAAVAKGADCLIIDAEGQYEGKYASANKYMTKLRAQVGPDYPIALAAFPYVDYHPGFPYSVFLGPGGAQYNQPQMYWKTIGTSVSNVYAHTFLYNRIYGRKIYPIGQTYSAPRKRELKRFRRLALNYGAGGVSWWSWQETTGHEWGVLGKRVRRIGGFQPSTEMPLLKKGNRGDMVVWAQEHLLGAGQSTLPVTGIFGAQTFNAVVAFQQQNGLYADGQIGTDTWTALLRATPVPVQWGARATTSRALRVSARPGGASAPLSAGLPAVRDELGSGPQR